MRSVGMGFDTVILTPYKVMAVSCIMTVYTKILTPSWYVVLKRPPEIQTPV